MAKPQIVNMAMGSLPGVYRGSAFLAWFLVDDEPELGVMEAIALFWFRISRLASVMIKATIKGCAKRCWALTRYLSLKLWQCVFAAQE